MFVVNILLCVLPFCKSLTFSSIGGERGIRTPGPVKINGFQDRRIRPLCHLSGHKSTTFLFTTKKKCNFFQKKILYLCNMNEILHSKFMKMALNEAISAGQKNEVPIGAIIIANGVPIAKTHNLTQTLNDPTAHAEMLAITAACDALAAKYLKDCTIYVTVEPCPMCAAALRWAQIDTIVWAADDEKFGYRKIAPQVLHPKTKIIRGVEQQSAQKLIEDFFQELRSSK